MQFSHSISSALRIKLKFSKEHIIIESKVILQHNFKKKKNQPKILQNFTTLCCFGASKKLSSTSNQHLSPYLSCLLRKRPESQEAQGTAESEHLCGSSLASHADGEQGTRARAQAMLVPPTSMASLLPESYGAGEHKNFPS